MVRRGQELAQIEERLTKLRELLDRRRTKKQEILELQAKVALNEADGLGFYDGERSGGGAPLGVGGGRGGSMFGRSFHIDELSPVTVEVPGAVIGTGSDPFAAPVAVPTSPFVQPPSSAPQPSAK